MYLVSLLTVVILKVCFVSYTSVVIRGHMYSEGRDIQYLSVTRIEVCKY